MRILGAELARALDHARGLVELATIALEESARREHPREKRGRCHAIPVLGRLVEECRCVGRVARVPIELSRRDERGGLASRLCELLFVELPRGRVVAAVVASIGAHREDRQTIGARDQDRPLGHLEIGLDAIDPVHRSVQVRARQERACLRRSGGEGALDGAIGDRPVFEAPGDPRAIHRVDGHELPVEPVVVAGLRACTIARDASVELLERRAIAWCRRRCPRVIRACGGGRDGQSSRRMVQARDRVGDDPEQKDGEREREGTLHR
ncbi:MAG: hypothetical protein U0234_22640 [Sandaracinus sp.]